MIANRPSKPLSHLLVSSAAGLLLCLVATVALAQPDGAAGATSAAAADGVAGATGDAAPPAPTGPYDTDFEDSLLSNTRQLITDSLRSGEGYFSADGERFIFQSELPGSNPFYQIFVRDLATGATSRVSPGIGLTTCSWIHPTLAWVMFSSTHEDPDALAKQAEEIEFRASGISQPYGWDYDRHYDIYQADADGNNIVNLTRSDGYDAEGSYSSDGGRILFASNREAYSRTLSDAEQILFEDDSSYFMDLYIMDADGSNVTQLTHSPGYDGGPFFSPDDEKVVWRRFNPDGNSAEIWTMDIDGSNQRQLTADAMVSWGPYFHPSGDYIIYSTNLLGNANFELFMIDSQGVEPRVRVTNTAGTDILPVFSPDGSKLAWSTTRTPDGTSQIHISDWNHARALELLGLD
ncbi:MAG TPA: biopolymer transporter Tol [Gammaproteobacteria bacterium]|jgi:Tol biopolymer transport system component|nr:biopolymer transporter Tol [Gammaproteobacteria bacterium]MDP6733232.1 biopolymer transporter Tol [Gammaproteobacteria bacterium]HAJ75939.1 biopolymer transporter Tol [Gammaproteobacteria bacterium]